jgi:RNA recognition motif-containing protein
VAFVQFTDYENAVNAFINLDNMEFQGRPLRVNFAYNTFAPEDVVQNRMKSLKVKVMIEGVDGEF